VTKTKKILKIFQVGGNVLQKLRNLKIFPKFVNKKQKQNKKLNLKVKEKLGKS
jgi:hypothetical protein